MTSLAPPPYRVFLVDDHAVFRSGVRAELSREADMDVVGEAGGVAEAIAGINSTKPHVVLLDVHMPDGGGVAVLRGIDSGPVCLALSVSDAAEDVIAVIRGGARGYVTKTISGSNWPRVYDALPVVTQCSGLAWQASYWTPSPGVPMHPNRNSIRNSTR